MTTKIESLTPEQKALQPIVRDEWIKIGLSTEPTDRDAVEDAVRRLYMCGKLSPPKLIIHLPSLASGAYHNAIWLTLVTQELPADQIPKWVSAITELAAELVLNPTTPPTGTEPLAKQLANPVRKQFAKIRALALDTLAHTVYGQHEGGWLAFYDYFRRIGLKDETAILDGLWALARTAGWCIPHENIVWVSGRPSRLLFDEQGRLHCDSGPASLYSDGWGVYSVHGVLIPSWVFLQPELLTVQKIDAETNSEVRRVMMQRFGEDRYLTERGGKLLAEDRFGKLYQFPFQGDDEPMTMVRVVNKTANGLWEEYGDLVAVEYPDPSSDEPFYRMERFRRFIPELDANGEQTLTYKVYWLQVPPTMKTAHEAVAWTFGLAAEDYNPRFES